MPPAVRKKAFVEAAMGLFFEHGAENTTMQQIASKAGVSYGLFYHYFSSKDDILTEAARQLTILPTIKEFLSHHEIPLGEHLDRLTTMYLGLLEENRKTVWMLISESRKRPTLLQNLVRLGAETEIALADYLRARQKCGEVRQELNLQIAASVIWGQLFSYHLWGEGKDDSPQSYISIILQGIKP
jgi:AcrR family transcriptional regulator